MTWADDAIDELVSENAASLLALGDCEKVKAGYRPKLPFKTWPSFRSVYSQCLDQPALVLASGITKQDTPIDDWDENLIITAFRLGYTMAALKIIEDVNR